MWPEVHVKYNTKTRRRRQENGTVSINLTIEEIKAKPRSVSLVCSSVVILWFAFRTSADASSCSRRREIYFLFPSPFFCFFSISCHYTHVYYLFPLIYFSSFFPHRQGQRAGYMKNIFYYLVNMNKDEEEGAGWYSHTSSSSLTFLLIVLLAAGPFAYRSSFLAFWTDEYMNERNVLCTLLFVCFLLLLRVWSCMHFPFSMCRKSTLTHTLL